MNPSRPFIERPVATSLLMLAVLLVGLLAYRMLPIAALPQVDYPTIQVTTLYPGASPTVMTSSITAPLERQFGQMPGLKQMSSTSSGGASVITLQFELELSLDVAEQQVQAAINAAAAVLPTDMPMPPVYSKVNPADAPIVTLAILSDTLPLTKVVDLVDTRLAQRLSQVPGVGLVTLGGGQRPAVRVRADPRALAAQGLNLEDLRTAIGNANVNQAKGSFDGPQRASTLDANDQLRSAEEYRRVIVAWKNGAPVRLSDVADVTEGAENQRLAAWAGGGTDAGAVAADTGGAGGAMVPPAAPAPVPAPAPAPALARAAGAGGDATPASDHPTRPTRPTRPTAARLEPAIVLNIQRQPGANVIDTVDRVRALLPQLQATLPAAVQVVLLADRTATIRASVRDVQRELLVSVLLVVGVIWVFLRSAAATAIPAIAVPLSLIGTFGVMYLAGFSLNNLSLMALTIATGFVVDDAIVMIENVSRHVEAGEPPLSAALEGAREIGFTIVSLTFSLIAVLIPLLFMGDVVGRLFREFAITLAVAILISAVVSLTLTPMMCGRLLEHRPEGTPEGPVARRLSAGFDALTRGYGRLLTVTLRHRAATLLVAAGTLALTVLLYFMVPKGFFPAQDTGALLGITEAPQSISFPAMAERQQALARALLADPAVDSVAAFIGVDGVNATLNTGRIQVALKPRAERDASLATVSARLADRAAAVRGIALYLQPVQDLSIEDKVGRTRYQFSLQVLDPSLLGRWVPEVVARLQREPALADVASDLQDQGLQAYVEIDRDAAGRLGITTAQIDNLLYSAFGQRLVSTVFTQSNLYRVVLEVKPAYAVGPDAIRQLYLVTATGAQVPLSSIARVVERPGLLAVNHIGQFPSATIAFDPAPGVSLGEAVATIRAALDELDLPASVQVKFQGAALAFQASLSNTLWLVLAAVVTMYIVLGVLYESYIHPVTILSTLPSATVGALLALRLAGSDLDLVAVVGIILLIGIVKKNAIMMIDFALVAEREHGMSPRDAIHQACLLRLRPILMTTAAALLGALPLMLSQGVGSELRQPLGLTMVGGLLVSQVLTLFTTPVIYLAFDRLSRRVAPQASG